MLELEKKIELGTQDKTETGECGSLLETNVMVIDNDSCKEYLDYNSTDNNIVREQIDNAFPFGSSYGLLYSPGTMNEE